MTQKIKGAIDMTGKTVGRWKVIGLDWEKTQQHTYFDGKRIRRRLYWICQCSCPKQTIKSVLGQNLRNGSSQSCGCWNKERDRSYERPNLQKKLAGQTINYLQVIDKSKIKKNNSIHWNCQCLLCGSKIVVDGRNLTKENPQFSCGCIKSKGEFTIATILIAANINFSKEYMFKDLPHRYFDFALFDDNKQLIALIEYDGEQHFNKSSKYYSENMIQHDKEKNEYCIKNKITLYRIPYWEYQNLQDLNSLLNPLYQINNKEN